MVERRQTIAGGFLDPVKITCASQDLARPYRVGAYAGLIYLIDDHCDGQMGNASVDCGIRSQELWGGLRPGLLRPDGKNMGRKPGKKGIVQKVQKTTLPQGVLPCGADSCPPAGKKICGRTGWGWEKARNPFCKRRLPKSGHRGECLRSSV